MDARSTIPAFDAFLAERGLSLQATVIGGAALQLLGVITRPTTDCDVMAPALTPEIVQAADEFAATRTQDALQRGWLNNGPASLASTLPPGWARRLEPLYAGGALQLWTLGREDLLRSKLFALVDRNIDLPDCIALRPTVAELETLLPWLEAQDGHSQWPTYVREVLERLAQKLGYEQEHDRGL
jgi:hypothetical protein